uniref:Uncharacterized protein MANES_09G030800 n=1 Tax=Rhizophora mucronata TaxID=61149 RepID=A0A2P2IKV5_RHIMU
MSLRQIDEHNLPHIVWDTNLKNMKWIVLQTCVISCCLCFAPTCLLGAK